MDVTDNTEQHRFESSRDGHRAELFYEVDGNRIELIHTGVPDALGGQGVGGELVRAAVGRASRDGLTIVPTCPFARRWLERHADEAATAPIDWDNGTAGQA